MTTSRCLTFKDHKIDYISNNKIINVYTDKKREKENYVITLRSKIHSSSE